jgi:hypothetical protein
MIIDIKEFDGYTRFVNFKGVEDKTLREVFGNKLDSVIRCEVNGEEFDDWKDYSPSKTDRVTMYCAPGAPLVPFFVTLAINLAISLVFTLIARALTPKPKTPKSNLPTEQTFGIAGLSNTTAPGTPKFIVLGEDRVFGHIIGTRISVKQGATKMDFSVLYYVGATGGNGYESISKVELNETAIGDIDGASFEVRLGTSGQSVIDKFGNVSEVYSDFRTLQQASPLVYTTRGNTVERITLVFQAAQFVVDKKGRFRPATLDYKVELKKNSDPPTSYVTVPGGNPFRVRDIARVPEFNSLVIDTGSQDKWDVQVELITTGALQAGLPTLYNVQEEEFTILAYPDNALLAVYGVASSQITSFESLRCSALVKGLKCNVWNGTSFNLQWTDKRMWICRELIVNTKIGMGHRIAASLFNDNAALGEQTYLDQQVNAPISGTEIRDTCNFILNDRKPGWDWIRDAVLGEVNAVMFPSSGQFKVAIERPRIANVTYQQPGTIIDGPGGAVKRRIGHLDTKTINTVRATYRNVAKDYKTDVIEVKDASIGSDPVRESPFQYDTIVRESQIFRQLQINLRNSILVKRQYVWKSPSFAQISEPLDVEELNYRSTKNLRGFQGICPVGSTVNKLILSHSITLAPSITYVVSVMHLSGTIANVVEKRNVTEGAGTWEVITPNSPFTDAPIEGDIWFIGEDQVAMVPIIIRSVSLDDDMNYDVVASEFIPAVWTEQPLPLPSQRKLFGLSLMAPLGMRSAAVREEIALNKDNVFESILHFDVIPGLPIVAGVALAGTATTMDLDSSEPNIDDYYNGWLIDITAGTGVGQTGARVIDYDGLLRRVFIDPADTWSTAPNATSGYKLRKERFGTYIGFKIEFSDDVTGPWIEPGGGRFLGVHGEISGRAQGATDYFRFTAIGPNNIENKTVRPIVQIITTGDGLGPADVSQFNAVQIGDRVLFTWLEVADLDVQYYRIKEGSAWASAGLVLDNVAGSQVELALVPEGDHTYWIKAYDRSGNESINATSTSITFLQAPGRKELYREDELLNARGTFNGTAIRLIGSPAVRMLSLSAAALWDQGTFWDSGTFYDTPRVLIGSYTTVNVQLPALGLARAYFDVGSGDLSQGSFNVEESHSSDGASYTPFKLLTTGDALMRFVRLRITLSAATDTAVLLINKLLMIVDAQARTISFPGQFFPASTLTLTFAQPFMTTPGVTVTPRAGEGFKITSVTNSQVTLQLGTGSPVSGVADVIVYGV